MSDPLGYAKRSGVAAGRNGDWASRARAESLGRDIALLQSVADFDVYDPDEILARLVAGYVLLDALRQGAG